MTDTPPTKAELVDVIGRFEALMTRSLPALRTTEQETVIERIVEAMRTIDRSAINVTKASSALEMVAQEWEFNRGI